MKRTVQKRQRPQPVSTTQDREYPTLREHLTSRRDLLTWMGASLVTSFWVGCVMGDDSSSPDYYTTRLPEVGSDLVTQTGGGSLRYYVNVSATAMNGYFNLIGAEAQALELCREVLAEHDFAQLAAATQGGDREPYWAAERALRTALQERFCDACWELTAALTIEAFVP